MRRLLLIPLGLTGLATLGLASANALVSTKQADARATGAIWKLSPTSITVGTRRGHRLTCNVTPLSPGVGPFAIGGRVKIFCADHVLVAISGMPGAPSVSLKHSEDPLPTTPTTTTTTTTASTTTENSGISGTISALSSGSITVTSSGGSDDGPQTLSCTISSSSPGTAGFATGNPVRMYCLNGALYQVKHNDTPPPTTTTTTTTTTAQNWTAITGTITALSGASISVQGGDAGNASLTCTIGSSSPSTSGFSTGNLVRMYCLNGALYSLQHSTPPATTSTTTTTTTTTTTSTTSGTSGPSGDYTYRDGTLTSLSATSITVSSGDGSLTCAVNANSPSTSGFAVGNGVRVYCQAGALIYVRHI